ncbi:zinc finger protein 547-like [Pteronotus mesoamericanus]|uniref:zinc finger protein 547-like n=1 Tax=Pteronotus mesoamericanus TaxID=1884717 RepID=UPI0023EBA787|nr:zinc finger protein 547-like [Pteronotus parnellii mesoamericanus]
MLENCTLISSLGCCCGVADVEAPTEQNLSVQVSQAKDSKTPLSSQESQPCESCGPIFRGIFLLVDWQVTQYSQNLLRPCDAAESPFITMTGCVESQR